MIYKARIGQQIIESHILENPYCGAFAEMAVGKTAATATAFNQMLYDTFDIKRPLIIAPLRVADSVWTDEFEKWDHLRHLTVSKILGTERQRKEALLRKANFWTINVENVAWLVAHYGMAWPFDAVIVDESSKFKSHDSIRFKALKSVRPLIKRLVCLSGTPASKSLLDLWSQLYLMDRGERLGDTIGKYRAKYFQPGQSKGYVVYDYTLKSKLEDVCEELIYDKIGDICISLKAKDYVDLPECIENLVYINLPPAAKKKYDDFEREQVLALDDGGEISPVNAAALSGKLQQFANGAVYDDEKNWHEVQRTKLDELGELVESANGNPVLVFYSFRHDLERIMKYFKAYAPRLIKTDQDVKDWNAGKIQIAVGHPASMSHGLNMQYGGHIAIWFGLTWSLELFLQGSARLPRPGQLRKVVNNKMIVRGTIDEDIHASNVSHEKGQDALMNAIKARIEKYKK